MNGSLLNRSTLHLYSPNAVSLCLSAVSHLSVFLVLHLMLYVSLSLAQSFSVAPIQHIPGVCRPPLDSRHYHSHCSLQKLWPFPVEGSKWAPLHSPLLLCPQGWKPHRESTTHPPACLTAWTQHHLLSLIILSLSLSEGLSFHLWLLFSLSFMSSFALQSHLSCFLCLTSPPLNLALSILLL